VEKDLKKIQIDIPALRSQLVELMKEGFSEIPLTDLLFIIKETCLINKES
jgi:hypothetical protein